MVRCGERPCVRSPDVGAAAGRLADAASDATEDALGAPAPAPGQPCPWPPSGASHPDTSEPAIDDAPASERLPVPDPHVAPEALSRAPPNPLPPWALPKMLPSASDGATETEPRGFAEGGAAPALALRPAWYAAMRSARRRSRSWSMAGASSSWHRRAAVSASRMTRVQVSGSCANRDTWTRMSFWDNICLVLFFFF